LVVDGKDAMTKAIAIGMLGLALAANTAAAQTAVEQAQILRDFQRSVVDYTERDECLLFPEVTSAGAPAPRIFTLPVAMVFRQLIAQVLTAPDGAAIGAPATHRATAMLPFPATELYDFPNRLDEVLPLLPAPLEYRLIDHDLVIRDTEADLIVAVLRDAVGTATTRR
jgi:hypothetical protein